MIRKRLLILVGIIFGFLFLFSLFSWLLSQNGTLEVTAPSNTAINVTVSNNDGFTKSLVITPAATTRIELKEGSYKVVSGAGSLKTIDIATMVKGETTKIGVSFGAQATVAQVASGIDLCPKAVEGGIYEYNCNGEGFIFRQNALEISKSILFDSQMFDYLSAYYNGFIGLPTNGKLSYMDVVTQHIQEIYLPNELAGSLQEITVATPTDPTQTYFALSVSSADAIYLYDNAGDTSPTKLKLSKNKLLSSEDLMNSISFQGNRLILYAGPLGHSDSGEGGLAEHIPEENNEKGSIFEYDLQGKLVKTITTPVDFLADRLIKINDQFYAADRIEGVEFFYLNSGTLQSIHVIDDITSIVPMGDKLYVQVGNEIFLFRPGKDGTFSIKSIYTPGDRTISSMYGGSNVLLFTASPGGTDIYDVYTLN